jgi:hypothetical protein
MNLTDFKKSLESSKSILRERKLEESPNVKVQSFSLSRTDLKTSERSNAKMKGMEELRGDIPRIKFKPEIMQAIKDDDREEELVQKIVSRYYLRR